MKLELKAFFVFTAAMFFGAFFGCTSPSKPKPPPPPPINVCDPSTQPYPHWNTRNGECMKSCGALGGIQKTGQDCGGLEEQLSWDQLPPNHCCIPHTTTTTTLITIPQYPKRTGLVKKCEKAVCDDQGPFNALGASLFWATWAMKNDRSKLERNLKYLADNGFDYIRVLGTVGRLPWWQGRVVDWRWSDYDSVISGLTDLAYDKYGLRIEWTLIGDGDQMIPNESDRFKLVDKFIAMSNSRKHKIMHFEIANEAWQNGFRVGEGYAQLKRLSKYMADHTDILVAASAVSGSEYNGDYCKEVDDLSGGDMDTFHYDRGTHMVDGFWRHVRQPWESCNRFSSSNEPMGPGSSVAKTNNPYHIVAAAMNTYLSKVAMYVWHTEAGVWGGTIKEYEGKSDLYENPSGMQFKVMKQLLPQGLAGWSRQNSYNNPNHPLWIFAGGNKDKIWTESPGYNDGVVRAYASVRGNEFVVLPIGIKNFVKMEAKRNMMINVYDIVTGEMILGKVLNQGEQFQINENGKGVYLIKGRYL